MGPWFDVGACVLKANSYFKYLSHWVKSKSPTYSVNISHDVHHTIRMRITFCHATFEHFICTTWSLFCTFTCTESRTVDVTRHWGFNTPLLTLHLPGKKCGDLSRSFLNLASYPEFLV